MRTIPLAALPNQELTVTLDLTRFVITLKTARGALTATISIDGVEVVSATRVLAGELILPYQYQELGNFLILTVNDELPVWSELGVTQTLFYFTPAELVAIRA